MPAIEIGERKQARGQCWYNLSRAVLLTQCIGYIRSYSAASSLGSNISFVKKLLEAFVLQPWQWGILVVYDLWQNLCCPQSDSELCAGSLAAPGSLAPSHHSSEGTEQTVTHLSLQFLTRESCRGQKMMMTLVWHPRTQLPQAKL